MTMKMRATLIAGLGAVLLAACDSVLDPGGGNPEGLLFSYSGAATGSFAADGNAVLGGDGLPTFETFAVAQRDSIGGLLLGAFRKTGASQGDLFILQIRGTDPATYTCDDVTQGPSCYGHLYIGVHTDGAGVAEQVYGISAGQIVISEVTDSRVTGALQLSLEEIQGPGTTLSIQNGSIDVPVVEGIFNSSFACLVVRLEKGQDTPCE